MRKIAALAAAALVGVGALTSTGAEARGGGALAAGLIGGLAAGALIGAAVSEAHAGPAYGYAPSPAYYPPPNNARPVVYRPVRTYVEEEDVPAYRPRPYMHRYEDDCPPRHEGYWRRW